MAEKSQYANFLSSPPAVLAYFRHQSGAGPTSPTTFQYTAVSYWRKGPKTTEIQSGDQTAILLVYSLWTGIARERLMIRACRPQSAKASTAKTAVLYISTPKWVSSPVRESTREHSGAGMNHPLLITCFMLCVCRYQLANIPNEHTVTAEDLLKSKPFSEIQFETSKKIITFVLRQI